jgi:hypothetical protein
MTGFRCSPHDEPSGIECFYPVQKHGAIFVVTDHRLDPHKGCHTNAMGYWRYAVQAAGRVKHQIACRKLHRMLAVGIIDQQLSAFIIIRLLRNKVAERSVRIQPFSGWLRTAPST